jgi:hypothetical protein
VTNPIDALMVRDDVPIYYDADFRVILESHLEYFRTNPNTTAIDIPAIDADKFKGDLWGLLLSKNIPPYLHWLVMRLTGLTSPNASDTLVTRVLIPASTDLNRIINQFMTIHRID